jgi:hypothetical protein
MQTVQLVIFLSIFNALYMSQTFDRMRWKVFGWELNTPLVINNVKLRSNS